MTICPTAEGSPATLKNAIRMNADWAGRADLIGAPGESRSLELFYPRTVDGRSPFHGIPTLGVVAVGKQMERTESFSFLATRVLAENGANIVKSYYCDGFERVAAACPVPIVIAGRKEASGAGGPGDGLQGDPGRRPWRGYGKKYLPVRLSGRYGPGHRQGGP